MRVRGNKAAKEKLMTCDFYVSNPKDFKGNWHEAFSKKQKIWMDLGYGKGGFITTLALKYPNINFIGIDNQEAILALAKKKIETALDGRNQPVSNVRLCSFDISKFEEAFSSHDEVERIFINFSNPWYKKRHKKRCLSYPRQLLQYRSILKPDGEIWFKTDYRPYLEETVNYFKESGFEISYYTEDLKNSDFQENTPTEYELFFNDKKVPVGFIVAKKV